MKLEQLAQIATGRADDTAVIPAELSGYAAQAAVQVLIKNWEVALQEGWPHNLVADIDNVVAVLRDVQQKAREQLPLENGGLAGKSVEVWKALLEDIDVSVYEAEDLPGQFGYTGCDADDYLSEEEAVNAAVLANKEALGITH